MTSSVIRSEGVSPSQRQRGFTQIELVVVFALICLLAQLLIPAVQGIHQVIRQDENINASLMPVIADTKTEIDALVDQSNAGSTQSLTWRLVVAATTADPATGGLDQDALNALYQNLLEREASIEALSARVNALLATHLNPQDRQLLLAIHDGLALALDGVRKMKAVIQSRVTALPAP